MGTLQRSRISDSGIDKRAHSLDRTRAGPACTDFGIDRPASPDDGTERLASPDNATDRLASPDKGTDRLASPDNGTDRLASADDRTDRLAFPDDRTDWLAFPDDRIDRLASRQLGLITRAQLRLLGLTRSAIHVRVRARRLHIVHRGVYRVGPVAVPYARELAALLACGHGSALSHSSGGGIWRMTTDVAAGLHPTGTLGAAPVDITTHRDCRLRHGIRIHRIELRQDEVTSVAVSARGALVLVRPAGPAKRVRPVGAACAAGDVGSDLVLLAVTTPARTLLDLASVLPLRDLENAVARAERDEIVRRDELLALVQRHHRRPGTPLLRTMLAAGASPALTRSQAEDRFLALLRRGQLPAPAANATVGGVEVDFLWRSERLVVEVDGFAFHGSQQMFERDRRRDAALTARGLRVMRVTWRQIVNEPEAVLVRLSQALAR
jgi:very-short-patch-repair endonuclease